jgi:hypothetical protein
VRRIHRLRVVQHERAQLVIGDFLKLVVDLKHLIKSGRLLDYLQLNFVVIFCVKVGKLVRILIPKFNVIITFDHTFFLIESALGTSSVKILIICVTHFSSDSHGWFFSNFANNRALRDIT